MPALGTGLAGRLGKKRREDPASYQRAWAAENREKLRTYARNYYHARRKIDPEFIKAHNRRGKWTRRKKKYGITKFEYHKRLEEQKGRCQICVQEFGPELRVDHDHRTGRVRALLCANCNSALGLMGEDPKRLIAAASYLERHQIEEVSQLCPGPSIGRKPSVEVKVREFGGTLSETIPSQAQGPSGKV